MTAKTTTTPSAGPTLPAGLEAKLAQSQAAITELVEAHGPGATLLCSGQDAVLVDVALAVAPQLEVTFIDTGFHFPETIETMLRIVERYSPKLQIIAPWRHKSGVGKPGFCCSDHKVEQLDSALDGKTAWLSGIRRADGGSRLDALMHETDRRGLAKLNPLIEWSDDEVDAYEEIQQIIVNPLRFQGYPSIGCRPCTSPIDPTSEDARSGRWAGSAKTECGIHF